MFFASVCCSWHTDEVVSAAARLRKAAPHRAPAGPSARPPPHRGPPGAAAASPAPRAARHPRGRGLTRNSRRWAEPDTGQCCVTAGSDGPGATTRSLGPGSGEAGPGGGWGLSGAGGEGGGGEATPTLRRGGPRCGLAGVGGAVRARAWAARPRRLRAARAPPRPVVGSAPGRLRAAAIFFPQPAAPPVQVKQPPPPLPPFSSSFSLPLHSAVAAGQKGGDRGSEGRGAGKAGEAGGRGGREAKRSRAAVRGAAPRGVRAAGLAGGGRAGRRLPAQGICASPGSAAAPSFASARPAGAPSAGSARGAGPRSRWDKL